MKRVTAISLCIVWAASAQTIQTPARGVTDPGVVTTRQNITPAGIPLIFKGRVYDAAFAGSGGELWVLNATQLYKVD